MVACLLARSSRCSYDSNLQRRWRAPLDHSIQTHFDNNNVMSGAAHTDRSPSQCYGF